MQAIKSALVSTWNWAGKKLVVAGVGFGLMALKAQHPDWPLPSEEFTRDLVVALLSAHTLTDIAFVLKTAGQQVVDGKAANG